LQNPRIRRAACAPYRIAAESRTRLGGHRDQRGGDV